MLDTRLRVLIIHQALAPYRVGLLNKLSHTYDVKLFLLRENVAYHRDLSQRELRSSLKIATSTLEENWVVWNRDVPWGIFKLLKKLSPDIVVTSEFSLATYFVLATRKLGGNKFAHVVWSEANPATIKRFNWWRRWLRKIACNNADSILLYSTPAIQNFAKTFNLPLPKFFRCANHQPEEVLAAARERGCASVIQVVKEMRLEAKKVILYVGRLAPEKNVIGLLKAFSRVYGRQCDVVLVLVGSGELRGTIEHEVHALGLREQVHLTGHLQGDALHGWYNIASVLALASNYEPYGAVVAEALAAGVPVLCSKYAGACALIHPTSGRRFYPEREIEIDDALRYSERWLQTASHLISGPRRKSLMPVAFQDDVDGFSSAVRYSYDITSKRLG